MTQSYTSESIEVLSGLDPVKKRPGMYTDTSSPNHLAQEVIDNSVDEAISGHASKIIVRLYDDNSLEIEDNGRGMPVDIHPEKLIPGVELILGCLHAGGKFSNQNYNYSGGLHGVGVSVVNALSERLDVEIKRYGKVYSIAYENGEKVTELTIVGKVGIKNTGTKVRFRPNPKYFDTHNYSLKSLKYLLKAKAVLCPSLEVIFENIVLNKKENWHYLGGISSYLKDALSGYECIPEAMHTGKVKSEEFEAEWAFSWPNCSDSIITESYVNLIPTIAGGTHVNGLRTGMLEAVREYCVLHNILPRGVKIMPDDVFSNCAYVLSMKLREPQFSGQTKERLSSRECVAFLVPQVKDSFSLWLNKNIQEANNLASIIIDRAQDRLKVARKVTRKKINTGPKLPGKLSDCISQDLSQTELFLVEGDSAGGSAKQARDREYQAIMPLRGKILNTWEVPSSEVLASQEIHDIAIAIGVDPDSDDISSLRYGKVCILADADSDGLHIATLLCALFLKHFKKLVENGYIYVATPPLYRIDIGKDVFYALDDTEKDSIIQNNRNKRGKTNVLRFKGLGEMNALQLKESTMSPDTRRLVKLGLSHNISDDFESMDELLAKKRSKDRRRWLEVDGNLADV
jgi:topoisomerase IV subunit B